MNEQSDLGWYLADINDMNETCYYQREDYVPGWITKYKSYILRLTLLQMREMLEFFLPF